MTPVYGKCEFCGTTIVVKKNKNQQGRYKRYCGQTCKNKQNKITAATSLNEQKAKINPDPPRDLCIDCGERPSVIKVGTKGFCLICVNKE